MGLRPNPKNGMLATEEGSIYASWVSPKQLTGGETPPSKAWAVIQSGKKLRPAEIRLFVALNAAPHEALSGAVATLTRHHNLPIGLVAVVKGKPQLLVYFHAASSWASSTAPK